MATTFSEKLGGSELTDTGTAVHPSETDDSIVIGGTTVSNSDIVLNPDGSAVFNDQGNAAGDFRVEGDTDANLFVVDASADKAGFGIAVPREKVEISGGNLRITNDLGAGGANTGKPSIVFSEDVSQALAHARVTYNGDPAGSANYLALACGDGAGGDFAADTDGTLFVVDTDRVGIKTSAPVTTLDVDGPAIVRAGRKYGATKANIPIAYGCEGDAVFSFDPTMDNDQLAAFCGLTTSQVQWETGSDANDSPGGAVLKFTGLSLSVGGHFDGCGFPLIPIEDAVTSAGVPGRSSGDLSATYYAEMWIKSNNATSRIYAGSSEYEHDLTATPHGATDFGNPGSYGYFMAGPGWATNTIPGTSWMKMSGYITGFHDDTEEFFESDASFFTPMALINWTTGSTSSSVMWVSGWKIWKVSSIGDRTVAGTVKGTAALFGTSNDIVLNADGSAVFNQQEEDVDFRVAGSTDTNLLYVNAGNNNVGIGQPNPVDKLQVQGTIRGNALVGGDDVDFILHTDGTAQFNLQSQPIDFQVQGDSETHLFFVDGGENRVGVSTSTPKTDFQVDGQALVEAGRGYPAARAIPVTYGGTGGDAVFSVDPTMDTDQLAAFFGRTTAEVSWETGSDGDDAPGGPAFKVTGQSISIGGHWGGAPLIPIEDATSRAEGATSSTYYGEMWVKCNQATPTIYAGSSEYDHDLTSTATGLGNPTYGYWINAGSGTGTVVGTSWQKISGYVTGFDDNDQYKFETSASLFAPLALVNWSGSDAASVTWISGWKIWKVSESGDRNFVGSNIKSGASGGSGLQFYSAANARILQISAAGTVAVNHNAESAVAGEWPTGGPSCVLKSTGTGMPLETGTVAEAALRIEGAWTGGNVLDFGTHDTNPYDVWLQGTNKNGLHLQYPISLNPSGGNVNINRQGNAYPLHVGDASTNGNGARCTIGGVWTNGSTRASKDNIVPLSDADATAALMALEPQTYNYKDTTEEHCGFIAEDVPDLVASGDRTGVAAMDIVAVLTRVVQRQEAQIKKLLGED